MLDWFPRGRWPSPCAGCGKKIPPSSRRAHDPATNKFYHPSCAPSPDPEDGRAPRSGPRSLETQSKAGDLPGFVTGDKLKPGPPRVAIYARVSTTKQETENQVVQLRDYAARMGWSVAEVLKETEHGWEPERRASFGKTAVITDVAAPELPDEKLLEASVARAEIEEQFKWLKDRYVVSLKPMWVRHDAAIPGHVFVCVMGLTLLRYLQWEVSDLHLSVKELVERLGKIRVAVVMLNKKPGWVLEEMGLGEAELVSRLKLLDEMPAPT